MSETIVITETVVEVVEIGAPGVPGPPGADGGGGAPDTADYLVGTAQAGLSAEIVAGATPGGELGGTWAAPTVDATHSGSSHAATQAAAEATAAATLAAHLAADVIDGDAAGGVLAGTFPNPGFAADMATQAELDAHITDATDAHDASAVSVVPFGTIAATQVQAALEEIVSEAVSDLTDAVILAPASSARNVIQPSAGAVIAAIVKAHAAQSVDLTQWQDSAGGVLMSIAPTGAVLIEPNAVFQTALILKSFDPASAQQETFQIKDSGGNTAFEVQNCGETIWRFLEPTQSSGLSVVDQVGIAGPLLNIFAVSSDGIEVRNDGSLIIVNTTGSALLASGTFMPWLDPTNGAAKFMVKGATLDGTVVTWEFEDGVYTPGGGGAPTAATYITQTPDAGLSAEQALSALATGLVKNTTGTGVLSIAVPGTDFWAPGGTDVAVADGGTGASTAAGARTNLGVIAANVPFTPAGTIAATDVQAAIEEVASEAGGGGISPTLFDANTVLAADTDDTPAALTMGASTILARLAAGNIKAATPAELRTLLDVPTNGEAILDALVDAKGDLIAATAADTVARLPVGANGKVLRADSNLTPGLGWVDPLVPYAGWMPVASAGKLESLPRYALASASLAPVSGTLYLIALPLPLLAGVTYTSISMVSQGAASVPLNQWFCLVKKSDLTLLRSTTDDTTTAWGTSTLKTLNLSSSYTPTADTLAYVGFMIAATTPNTFRSAALQTVVTNLAPILVGTSDTGMTSPLADGTALTAMTGTASAFYAVVG